MILQRIVYLLPFKDEEDALEIGDGTVEIEFADGRKLSTEVENIRRITIHDRQGELDGSMQVV